MKWFLNWTFVNRHFKLHIRFLFLKNGADISSTVFKPGLVIFALANGLWIAPCRNDRFVLLWMLSEVVTLVAKATRKQHLGSFRTAQKDCLATWPKVLRPQSSPKLSGRLNSFSATSSLWWTEPPGQKKFSVCTKIHPERLSVLQGKEHVAR